MASFVPLYCAFLFFISELMIDFVPNRINKVVFVLKSKHLGKARAEQVLS